MNITDVIIDALYNKIVNMVNDLEKMTTEINELKNTIDKQTLEIDRLTVHTKRDDNV